MANTTPDTLLLLIALATFKRPTDGPLATLAHARYEAGDTVQATSQEQADTLRQHKLAALPHGRAGRLAGKLTGDAQDFEAEYRTVPQADGPATLLVRFGKDGGAPADGEGDWFTVKQDGQLGAKRKLPAAAQAPAPLAADTTPVAADSGKATG